jgi:hypothetical protein
MPAARQLSTNEKHTVLRNLPEGTTRVQVIDEKGKQAWRKPDDVVKTDNIVFGNNGPVVMKGTPGRKAAPKLEPVNDNIAEVIEAKEYHLENDPLTALVQADPDQADVLDAVMVELAREASSLEFERKEAERNGNDTSTYSLRRARILQAVGDMHLQRKKLADSGGVDLDSNGFEAVFGYALETFREAMGNSGVRPELIETTFAKLGKVLESGWKEEARIKARNAK